MLYEVYVNVKHRSSYALNIFKTEIHFLNIFYKEMLMEIDDLPSAVRMQCLFGCWGESSTYIHLRHLFTMAVLNIHVVNKAQIMKNDMHVCTVCPIKKTSITITQTSFYSQHKQAHHIWYLYHFTSIEIFVHVSTFALKTCIYIIIKNCFIKPSL